MDDKSLYEKLKKDNVPHLDEKKIRQSCEVLKSCLDRMGYKGKLDDIYNIKKFIIKFPDGQLKTKSLEHYNVLIMSTFDWRGEWTDRIVSTSTLWTAGRVK
jgi:hypothetical protein